MTPPEIVVLLHMFNPELLVEYVELLRNITEAGHPFDLFVAIPLEADPQLYHQHWPEAVIVPCEDRGFDVASFFTLFKRLLDRPYRYLLKLHTKSNPVWRRELVSPLLGSAWAVKQSLRALSDPAVAMVGAKQWLFQMGSDWGNYTPHIDTICRQWRQERRACSFVAGTIFWLSFPVLREAVIKAGVDLEAVVAGLNTKQTLDWVWYRLTYPELYLRTEAEARRHWETKGQSQGLCCNSLMARQRGITSSDWMLEHSYERFFGLVVRNNKQLIIGL
jgi:hypothetical protein